MHSIDKNGNVCVDLDKYNGLGDSIRLRAVIDDLLIKYNFPIEISHFSLTIILRTGKRYYISNLYLWTIPYRTEGYIRGDIDHDYVTYNGKEYFIQGDIHRDETQQAIIEMMQQRYKLYTVFAMVRQSYECDLIVETYSNFPVSDPDTLYKNINKQLEQFILGFMDEIFPQSFSRRTEYNQLEFFQNKEFRRKMILNDSTSENTVLTKRELQCLFLVTQGKSTKEIAESLFLSVDTVTTHFKSVRKKLSCHTITQAVMIAIKKDLFKHLNYPDLGIP